MKKNILIFLAVLDMGFAFGQNDTIEVAKGYQTLLFFNSPIEYSPIGNSLDFVQVAGDENSAYNQRIVKLSQNLASKKEKAFTNLTVITEDGNSYSFILKTVKTPKDKNIKVNTESAIFNLNGSKAEISKETIEKNTYKVVKPEMHQYGNNIDTAAFDNYSTKEKNIKTDSLFQYNRTEYFRLKSYYHQFDEGQIPRYFTRNGNVLLWLENVYYDHDHLFFQLKIQNKQSIDFDIRFIHYLLTTTYKKSSSNQETPIKPVFTFKQPKKIKGKTENVFIVVFEKFSLEKKMAFQVDIKEDNGARTLLLSIEPSFVNNPYSFYEKTK